MAKRPREFERTVTLGWHSCALVHYSLIQRLKEVESNLRVLKEARLILSEGAQSGEDKLPDALRYQLPGHMQSLTLDELAEQVDSWITLQQYCEDLIRQFDPGRQEDESV